MKQWHLKIMTLLVLPAWSHFALASEPRQPQEPLYKNDFQQAEPGSVPPELMLIEGTWAIAEEGGRKFLELEGAPPIVSPVLFGPTRKENIAVSARIHGTRSGRRFPSFGVGLGNVSGSYRLMVSPAKKAIELFKGETLQTSLPYDWNSGKWMEVYLQIRPVKEGEWKIEGLVWEEDQERPQEWTLTWEEKAEIRSGKASIVGVPYSGTPIRFDEIQVLHAREKP
jgi:hypothetical protein